MKTFIIILVAVAAGFVIGHYAFKNKAAKNASYGTPNPADTVNTFNFAPTDSSDEWVKKYKMIWKTIVSKDAKLADSLPQSFTIKSQDVLSAMGIDSSWKYITKLRYMRLTLGYDSVSHTMKAFIQPVVNVDLKGKGPFPAGKALFFDKQGKIVDANGQRIDSLDMPHFAAGIKSAKTKSKSKTNGTYVADLSTPCPNTCGN